MHEILRLSNISLSYQAENGEVQALKHISFTANEGELIAIVGPSGCGKSTLLSIISGLTKPTSGKIYLDGSAVEGVSEKIGYMQQKDNLLSWRNIRSNVLFGLEIRGQLTDENKKYADNLLKTYGLADFADKYPSQLSGGMRQRAALIRTLAVKPDILLLDEAFSALDYQTRLEVTDDVFNILKKEGKTALIVTHDIPEGISMSDRVIILTNRPAYVADDIKIKFSNQQDELMPPLKRRNMPEFGQYFNQIWKKLETNIKSV